MESNPQKYQTKIQVNIQSPTNLKITNSQYQNLVEQKIKQYISLANFDTKSPKQRVSINYTSRSQNSLSLSNTQQQTQKENNDIADFSQQNQDGLRQSQSNLINSQQQQYDFSIDDIVEFVINPLQTDYKQLIKILKQVQQKLAQNQQEQANIQTDFKKYQKVDFVYEAQRGIVLYNIINENIHKEKLSDSFQEQLVAIKEQFYVVWTYWENNSNGKMLNSGNLHQVKQSSAKDKAEEIQKDITSLQHHLQYANNIIQLELRKKQLQKAIKFLIGNESHLRFIIQVYKRYFNEESFEKILIPMASNNDQEDSKKQYKQQRKYQEQNELSNGSFQQKDQKVDSAYVYNQGVKLYILNRIIQKHQIQKIALTQEELRLLYDEMQAVLLSKQINKQFMYKYFEQKGIWNLNNQILICGVDIEQMDEQYKITDEDGNIVQILAIKS